MAPKAHLGTDLKPLDSVGRYGPFQVRCVGTFAESPREQEQNRALVEPSERKCERAGRGRIEPLEIVNRAGPPAPRP